MSYGGFAPYVPVAVRRAKAQKQLEKMKKKGLNVQPVQLSGRKIADSFWGKGWCDHMESFGDYANRLPRGRTYVRNGSVCHLDIKPGQIEAIVSGSSLYNVSITILPLAKAKWDTVKNSCTGRISSLIDLLRGKLDRGVMEVVSDRRDGLFPLPGEIKFNCDCPDWAGMCKHIAAVLYGVGARLDHSPEMLFVLRGVDHKELVDVSAAVAVASKAGTSRRRIAAAGLADVFGVEMAEKGEGETVVDTSSKKEINARKVTEKQREGETMTDTSVKKAKAVRKAIEKKGEGEGMVDTSIKKEKTARKVVEKQTEVAKTYEKKALAQPQVNETIPAVASPPPFPDPFTGEDVRIWRALLGETQYDFAARIKITSTTISQWEKKGTTIIEPQSRTFARLLKAWEMTHR